MRSIFHYLGRRLMKPTMIPKFNPFGQKTLSLIKALGRHIATLGHDAHLAQVLLPKPAQPGFDHGRTNLLAARSGCHAHQSDLALSLTQSMTGTISSHLVSEASEQHL